MTRSSVIPTRRSRWPGTLALATVLVAAAAAVVLAVDHAGQALANVADGFDEGYAAAMNQVADSVGAAYSVGYRTAQREAAAACNTPRKGPPL